MLKYIVFRLRYWKKQNMLILSLFISYLTIAFLPQIQCVSELRFPGIRIFLFFFSPETELLPRRAGLCFREKMIYRKK